LFYHVFGRFSVRGVQQHDKKIEKINLTLVLFWPLTHPPTTGVTGFFFIGGPLSRSKEQKQAAEEVGAAEAEAKEAEAEEASWSLLEEAKYEASL
jgi:hypothetical protein